MAQHQPLRKNSKQSYRSSQVVFFFQKILFRTLKEKATVSFTFKTNEIGLWENQYPGKTTFSRKEKSIVYRVEVQDLVYGGLAMKLH